MIRLATYAAVVLVLALGLWVAYGVVSPLFESSSNPPSPLQPPTVQRGLLLNDPKAFPGYTLLAPMTSPNTYLIDMQGKVVRTWSSKCDHATTAYLLENGHMLRVGPVPGADKTTGGDLGGGGWIQEFTWDGQLVWDYKFLHPKQMAHHGVRPLPNGHVLLIAWDARTPQEAVAAGRRPDLVGKSPFLPDSLIEIQQTGKTTGKIVWEWRLWDHLIQDHDKSRANYGNVAAHPELVDINFGDNFLAPIAATRDGADKLRSIGYLGSGTGKSSFRDTPDWTHTNSVSYNPELDQVVVSVHAFSEIWVIDHSTTTAQAATHRGGKSGKGGDLLYRWGNPRAYRAGSKKDQWLFGPHSAEWIPRGLPGEGHILVFNNGLGRPDGAYSSVDEIVLPVDAQGHYPHLGRTASGPARPVWSYTDPEKTDFFAPMISGAQRLPGGNTLICSGYNGTLFEVTPKKEMVWKYVNPTTGPGPGPGPVPSGFGDPAQMAGPPLPGQIMSSFQEEMLQLTADQKVQLARLQKKIDADLAGIFSKAQQRQFRAMREGSHPGGFEGAPQPGQVLTPFQQARLKLTAGQKKQMRALQKEIDARLARLLTSDQQRQFQQASTDPVHGGPARVSPGGASGLPGFGAAGGGSLFQAYRYRRKYPGLVGKDLTPGPGLEEVAAREGEGRP
jgi:hypothetical protein